MGVVSTGIEGGVERDDDSDIVWFSGWVTTGSTWCGLTEVTTDGTLGAGGIAWFTITTLLVVISGISIGFDWVAILLPSLEFCLFNTFFFVGGFVIGSWCFFFFW